MAEVLSQSQIDALLNAVRTGEKDPSGQGSDSGQDQYRKYDFYSPRKFTKDRINMLHSIYENYARVVNTRLNARMRSNCELTVESVEEQRYHEFSNALTEGDVLTLADVTIKDVEQEVPIFLYLATPLSLSMIDRLMGGEGDEDENLDSDYSFTEIELHLYQEIVEDMVNVMEGSWESYIPVSFQFDRIDSNPTMSQLLGLDETVVIVDMKVKFPNCEGRFSICLPGEVLMEIFGEQNRENSARKVAAEKKTEEIFDSLRDSELEIVAELGNTQLTLSDVYHLNVGDVIDIGTSKESPIYLEIGGYRWFTGRVGTHKKNMAVKIESVYQAE